jgi:predicted dehydrogenase
MTIRTRSRRDFLKTASLTTFGIIAAPRGNPAFGYPANEKLSIGIIDENYLGGAAKRFPAAKTYVDYRKLIEAPGIDAVVVSTPDHNHAPATLIALEAGKHVYCEKPLTHSVWEARQVARKAEEKRRATQMGTQIHALSNYRRAVELVRTGAIGSVGECHVWCGKNWGGGERPKETPAIPPNIHYDLWLGPAPYRPYHSIYLPANWRRWWDFGGGTLGDMGCHFLDLPFWALTLTQPTAISAEGSPVHAETAPLWLAVHWEFPARGDLPPVQLSWYDSGKQPDALESLGMKSWDSGVLFVGSKGALIADYSRHQLLPAKDFTGFEAPRHFIEESVGHHREWIEACKDGRPTTCNFTYAGNMTEAVLLGNVAYRRGKRLTWDPHGLRVTNDEEANRLIRREYRPGWI